MVKSSWMMKGNKAKEALEKEEVAAEQRKKESGRMYRFWLPENGSTSITFLDGNLDEDGVLDTLMYYEHNVFMNGNWKNWFACTKEIAPCPICEGGDSPSLVGVFTIIDHSEWTGKNGQLHKDERKLFVAKRQILKQLQMIAAKRGGLAGCTFDVMRTGDKSPGCGNVFDFTEKRTLKEIASIYKEAAEGPADYEDQLPYYPPDDLRKMGFGSQVIGSEKGIAGGKVDYTKEL
jgi:hypothetical protein